MDLGCIGDAQRMHWGCIKDEFGMHKGCIGDASRMHWGCIEDVFLKFFCFQMGSDSPFRGHETPSPASCRIYQKIHGRKSK